MSSARTIEKRPPEAGEREFRNEHVGICPRRGDRLHDPWHFRGRSCPPMKNDDEIIVRAMSFQELLNLLDLP
jgi:hypothetical protein